MRAEGPQQGSKGRGLDQVLIGRKGQHRQLLNYYIWYKWLEFKIVERSLWFHANRPPPLFSPITSDRLFPWSHTVMQLSGLGCPERDVCFLFLVPHGTFLIQCQFTINNTSNTTSLVECICLKLCVCVYFKTSCPHRGQQATFCPKKCVCQLSAPALKHTLTESSAVDSWLHSKLWFQQTACVKGAGRSQERCRGKHGEFLGPL